MKKWFTWHRWPEPKDKKIESVYEISVLLGIFLLVLFFYVRMNRVSVIREELDVACVDREYYYEDKDSIDAQGRHPIVKGSFHPAASIFYRIPMTDSKFLKEESRRNSPSPNDCLILSFGGGNDIDRVFSAPEPPFLQQAKRSYDSLLTTMTPPLDSLMLKPMFYLRHLSHDRDNILFSFKNFDTAWKVYKNSVSSDSTSFVVNAFRHTSPSSIQRENFFSGSSPLTDGSTELPEFIYGIDNFTDFFFFKVRNRLGDPGWLTLEDVSQAYFDLRLHVCDIDSTTLRIDFVGATEFSQMEPVPDRVTMSSIEFTDQKKILSIMQRGLRFHAKFKELENRQEVRLFFLTSVMAALVTIFIVFLVVGVYKVFSQNAAT